MPYDIFFSHSAFSQFKKLDKTVQERIISALERIRIQPENYVIRLVGIDRYKLRVGDYRVILRIEGGMIIILKIGHRKNIYRF